MEFEFVNDCLFLNVFICIDVLLNLMYGNCLLFFVCVLLLTERVHSVLHFLHGLICDFLVFLLEI